MARVHAMFTSRDVLSRGLTALHDIGIENDQVQIREQRPKTGEPGFKYVDDGDREQQVRMMGDVDDTLLATGDNLLGAPTVGTTDSRLDDLLEAMRQQEDDEERPEYRAGTRYQVIVNTAEPDEVSRTLKDNGGRDIRIGDS